MAAANVSVAVRIRPVKNKTGKAVLHSDHHSVVVRNSKDGKTQEFCYDHVFNSADRSSPSYVSQESLFDTIGNKVLDCAFAGLNSTVFAYGQSGSGKTYTMMGADNDAGFIPRLCDAIFARVCSCTEPNKAYRVEASFCELYNERVLDLLRPGKYKNLRIREHKKIGPYVEGLTTLAVDDVEAAQTLIAEGIKVRAVAATKLNERSSRSHAVLTLVVRELITDKRLGTVGETVSKINLVDLAGSERQGKTQASGMRLREAGYTNKSLLTLGMVIHALAAQSDPIVIEDKQRRSSPLVPRSAKPAARKGSRASMGSTSNLATAAASRRRETLGAVSTKGTNATGRQGAKGASRRSRSTSPTVVVGRRRRSTSPTSRTTKNSRTRSSPSLAKDMAFVPYRDSVLTWLLKESLGGNSATIMIATISSSCSDFEETISTLRYADRAKHIVNKPVVNEDETAAIVRELREEIARLKARLAAGVNEHGEDVSAEEAARLQEELEESERLMLEKSLSWEDRLKQTRQELQRATQEAERIARDAEEERAMMDEKLRLLSLERDKAEEQRLQLEQRLSEEKEQRISAEYRLSAVSTGVGTDPLPLTPPPEPRVVTPPQQPPVEPDRAELERLEEEAERARAEAEANREELQAFQRALREKEEAAVRMRKRVETRRSAMRCLATGQASAGDFDRANLKEHVLEALNVKVCPRDVHLDKHIVKGWCEKRVHLLKVWRKRWCELDLRTAQMTFFPSRDGSAASHIDLRAINQAVVDNDELGSQQHCFFVMTHDRTFRLKAPSEQALAVWCTAVNSLVEPQGEALA
eukprot:m.174303 g.174303  ORF g.174303 m.174303 type:complete len:813 (-) comp17894_c0_seq1:256-2694(-)